MEKTITKEIFQMGVLLRGKKYYYKKQIDHKVYYRSLHVSKGQEALLYARIQQLDNQITAKHYGIHIPGACTVAFKDYIKHYLKQKAYKKSLDRDRVRLDTMADFFGTTPMDQLNKDSVLQLEAYLTGLKKKSTTMNRYFEVLSSMMNLAIEDGYAKDNPCKYYKRYIEDFSRRCLSDEEASRVIQAARDIQANPCSPVEGIIYDLVWFVFNTGLRLSEVLNLKPIYINIYNKYITIPITDTKYSKRSNSTNKKYRVIYLNNNSLDIITKYLNNNNHTDSKYLNNNNNTDSKYCEDINNSNGYTDTSNGEFVFPLHFRDTPLHSVTPIRNPNIVYHAVQKIRKRTGIKDFCFHQIRHTVSTWLSSQVSLTTAKVILGHSDIKTTMRYVHPEGEEARKGVEQIAEKMSKISPENLSVPLPC